MTFSDIKNSILTNFIFDMQDCMPHSPNIVFPAILLPIEIIVALLLELKLYLAIVSHMLQMTISHRLKSSSAIVPHVAHLHRRPT